VDSPARRAHARRTLGNGIHGRSVIRPPTSSGIRRRQPGRDGGPGRRLSRRYGSDISAEEIITCHHNYTEQEEHFGKKVWLTRKGAINAAEGKRGLIPGSMGTRSYVVTGKGNKASFNSAPHGAGRNFSRSEARKRFTIEELNDVMKGIEWRAGNADAFLDEIPGAYKDVDVVMADAADLVSVDHTLRQILNVKGD
jgi:tRNA-splicing ligase RtcB